MEPTVIVEESDMPIGQMCTDVFGAGWGSFKIVHVSTGGKIGVVQVGLIFEVYSHSHKLAYSPGTY